MARPDFARRFTLIDAAALISGAAVAAAHCRLHAQDSHSPSGWLGAAFVFAWVTVTATGPFLLMLRRWFQARGWPGMGVGDWLWLLWGIPWIGTAVLAANGPIRTVRGTALDSTYVGTLSMGLLLVTATTVPILISWAAWRRPRPEADPRRPPWSRGVGLALTAAWPLQCGVGLVMMG